MNSKNTPQKVDELIAQYNRELMATYRRREPEEAEKPEAQAVMAQSSWLDIQFPAPDILRDKAAIDGSAIPLPLDPESMVPPESSPGAAEPGPVIPPEPSPDTAQPGPVISPEPSPGTAEPEPVIPSEPSPGAAEPGPVIPPEPSPSAAEPEPGIPSEPSPGTAEPEFPYTDSDLNGEVPRPVEPPSPPPTEEQIFEGELRIYAYTARSAEPQVGARVTVSRPGETGDLLYAGILTGRDGFTPVLTLPSVNPKLTMSPGPASPFIPYNIRVSKDGFRTMIFRNVPVYGNNRVTQPAALIPLPEGILQEEAPAVIIESGPADL